MEDREANEAGVRPGPRIYTSGWLMEWLRIYYKMGIAISSPAHLRWNCSARKICSTICSRAMCACRTCSRSGWWNSPTSIGVPVATHEIYPAAFVGVDNTEHTDATSRRGYSPKIATLQRSYEDVIQIFGKSGRILCPMISYPGMESCSRRSPPAPGPALQAVSAMAAGCWWHIRGGSRRPAACTGSHGKMVMDVMNAGGLIVAGTDTPNGFNLHGEMEGYVMAGMTPYQALRTATVNSSKALGLDAGSIEPGNSPTS